jgi:thiosulfate reductase cytochrome b subunit
MPPSADPRIAPVPYRSAVVRSTHWLMVVAFFALLVSGLEIVISHPRFYWGEVGNVMTKPAFTLHIPSSRDTVPTAYKYVMPDQNGWSRYLHFQAAWLVLFTGAVYVLTSLANGHFRKDLVPQRGQRGWQAYTQVLREHLRLRRASEDESYNVLQRTAYLTVIFVLFPLMIWTGLAMSPAFTAVAPWSVELIGGRQTARTLHFFLTGALVLFLIAHVAMIVIEGFRSRMTGMITGHVQTAETTEERA